MPSFYSSGGGGGASNDPVYYAEDYGAVFDGTTDDKAAIQSAIDAANSAGGGVVVLPGGTAKVSGAITLYSNIEVRGQGRAVTVLQTTATSGALPGGAIFTDGGSDVDNITLCGFKVLGHGEDETSGTGINLQGTGVRNNIRLEDLHVEGFPNFCIALNDPIMSSFRNLFLKNCGQDALYVNIGTSCLFENVYVTGADRSGLHLKSHTYSKVFACAAEYCTTGYWLDNTHNVELSGCGGEIAMNADAGATAGGVSHYRLENASHITLTSCYSTKFAYLSGANAQHIYVTGSDHVKIQQFRGKAPLGGADPGVAPTNTIKITSSEVHAENVEFEADLGGGQSGTFTSEIKSDGRLYRQGNRLDTRVVQIQVSDPNGSALTTGDGKAYFRVNSDLNGWILTGVAAHVTTASSSGTPTVQIHNVTDAVDMLSTALTIDASEKDSSTAATAAVINASNDDVATGDELRIDVDAAGTGTKGLIVELTFAYS
jgi:hypothetical protein